MLSISSSGFLVGDSLSLADLGLLEVLLAIVDYWNEEQLQEYPDVLVITCYVIMYYNPEVLMRGIISVIEQDPICSSRVYQTTRCQYSSVTNLPVAYQLNVQSSPSSLIILSE